MEIDRVIQDKEAQLVILNAILLQMCNCECEHKYVEQVRNQIQKELDDTRKLKK